MTQNCFMSCFGIPGEYFCRKLRYYIGQIIITVKAIDWEEGNVGHVHVCLSGGSCRIDWGDEHITKCHTSRHEKQPEWIYVLHCYPNRCKVVQERFNIIISSDSDNIIGIGIQDDSGDMKVENVDIRECQSLVNFRASYLIDHFDLTTNPGIRDIDLRGEACGLADFSNSTELRNLYFGYTGGGRHRASEKLDLTKCDKLEYLECCYAFELTHIALSNRSALKKLVFDAYTPLSDKSIEIIKRIVERNGGEIVKISDDF